MEENGFTELHDVEALEELLTRASASRVILFKHSNTCGVSARAYREMAMVQARVAIVTVQDAQLVSDEIESRYALPHETPQVLIVHNDKLVWSASHFKITADAVNRAMNKAVSE